MATDYSQTTAGGYNLDVFVTDEFVSRHPILQNLLKVPAIEKPFAKFDKKARSAKVLWIVVSTAALFIGIIAILGVLAEIAAPGLGTHMTSGNIVAIEALALLSLLLFLASRLFRLRGSYLNNCFARERLRQFRFQVFLHGPLVQQLVAGDAQAKR